MIGCKDFAGAVRLVTTLDCVKLVHWVEWDKWSLLSPVRMILDVVWKYDSYDNLSERPSPPLRSTPAKCLNIATLFAKIKFENLEFFEGQSQKIVSLPFVDLEISRTLLRISLIGGNRKSRNFITKIFLLIELLEKSTRGCSLPQLKQG